MGHVGVQVLRGQAGYAVVLVRVPLEQKKETRFTPAAKRCMSLALLCSQDPVTFSNLIVEILPKNTRKNKCKHLQQEDLKIC